MKVPSVFILGHSDNPPTAKLEHMLTELGLPAQVIKVAASEALPNIDDVRGLIIMGALASIYHEDHYIWLQNEMAFVEKILHKNIPIFGICFGCQMLAQLTGGSVFQGEKGREFGFVKVDCAKAGSLLSPLNKAEIFQAHGDTYTLGAGVEQLLEGGVYTQQGTQFGEKAYGVQFHPELTPDVVQRWHSFGLQRGWPHVTNLDFTPEEHAKMAEEKFAKTDVWLKEFLAELFA